MAWVTENFFSNAGHLFFQRYWDSLFCDIGSMLLTGNKLHMVDWDDVLLSDPMRDVGLFLWWYVARQQWLDFFVDFGQQMDDFLVDRIFWWAARTSLAVALWHVEHNYDCTAFLTDLVAALNKENNPHAVFN